MNKTYVTWNEIHDQVQSIAQQLAVDNWKPEVIVGIARGGLHPALLLSNYFNVPMETIRCQLRDGDGTLTATGIIPADKKILIVDDINDTGATLLKITQELDSIMGSQVEVKVAVLYDNESSDFNAVDYSAITINKANEDQWFVYPWEDWWARR